MEVYFLRHGDAEAALFNTEEDDFDRELTGLGQDAIAYEAIALRNFVPSFDIILTSPLTRAVQTAEIFGKIFNCPNIMKSEALRPPCSVEILLETLALQEEAQRVLCVGHTPTLGEMATEMITGIGEERFFPFRKGGILRMDIDFPSVDVDAKLKYFLDPDILKMLGEYCAMNMEEEGQYEEETVNEPEPPHNDFSLSLGPPSFAVDEKTQTPQPFQIDL